MTEITDTITRTVIEHMQKDLLPLLDAVVFTLTSSPINAEALPPK